MTKRVSFGSTVEYAYSFITRKTSIQIEDTRWTTAAILVDFCERADLTMVQGDDMVERSSRDE